MQRFARVDVAEAGDDTLIEQCRFERDALAGQRPRQPAASKDVSSGSGPMAANVSRDARPPPSRSITPKRRGSLNVTVTPVRQREYDMVVEIGCRADSGVSTGD